MSGGYSPIPTVQAQDTVQPYEHLDLSPEAFGAGVGKAIQRAGQTLKQVGEEQNQIALDLQHQHNETLVIDASSGASNELGKIEAEYRQLHGNDAIAKLPEYQKRVTEVGEKFAKTLSSPEAQRAFHARFTNYRDGTMKGFGLYAADQADQAYVGALEGSVSSAKSRLVRQSGLGNAAPNYDELLDNVARLGTKLGWEKEQVHAYLQKQTGDVVSGMVEARIAANQLGQAQKIFNAASNANVPGTDVPFLDADSEARISHTLHVEIKSAQAIARVEGFEDAHNLAQSDIQARMLNGTPLPPEAQARIQAGFTPKQFAAYKADVGRADMIYKETGDFARLPSADIMGHVEKLKPVPDATGYAPEDFADRQATYLHAVQIAQNTINARNKDPGAAMREAFPTTVGTAWQRYEKEKTPESLQAALKISGVAQNTVGIAAKKQRLMPDQFAMAIAGNITGAPPQQAYKQLQSWAEQFGPQYWGKAFKQMSNLLPAPMKVAAIMPDESAASLLIETSRQDQAKLAKALDLPASGAGSLAHQIATDPDMMDLRASLSQRAGGGGTAEAVSSSAEILAKGLMQTRGITSPSEAANDAIKRTIKDKYAIGRVNDKPFHVPIFPTPRPIAPIEQGAADVLRTLTPGQLDLPPNLPPGLSKAEADRQWADAVRTGGFWVTNDDASGLILYAGRSSGGTPVRIKGQEVTYTWDQLQQASIDRKPSIPEQVLRDRIPGVN